MSLTGHHSVSPFVVCYLSHKITTHLVWCLAEAHLQLLFMCVYRCVVHTLEDNIMGDLLD